MIEILDPFTAVEPFTLVFNGVLLWVKERREKEEQLNVWEILKIMCGLSLRVVYIGALTNLINYPIIPN